MSLQVCLAWKVSLHMVTKHVLFNMMAVWSAGALPVDVQAPPLRTYLVWLVCLLGRIMHAH